ncbi:MAG TPA: VWA domain-containing protein, partial [Myxococcaceae bacterium]|nr:VWA domain-containing protein [Myxococcaceae bacterium]
NPDRGIDAWLILDTSRSLDWGTARCLKREAAGELVAAASVLLARRGNRVGALIFDKGLQHIIPPSSGRAGRSTLIAEASRDRGPGEDGPTDLARALSQAARLIRRPSLVIVVSDFLAPAGWQQPLRVLGFRHEVLAAVIGDPRESELPDVGLLVLEDPETKRQIEVDTGNRRLRERFRTAAQEQRRQLLVDLRAARASVLELSTAEDVLLQLLRLFQRVETGRRGQAGTMPR